MLENVAISIFFLLDGIGIGNIQGSIGIINGRPTDWIQITCWLSDKFQTVRALDCLCSCISTALDFSKVFGILAAIVSPWEEPELRISVPVNVKNNISLVL
jgi:hypothetical protein